MGEIAREYGTDRKKEVEGVWHTIRGTRWLLARVNNPEYRALAFRRTRGARQRSRRSSESQDALIVDLLVNSIVRDWEAEPRRQGESEEAYKERAAFSLMSRDDDDYLDALPYAKDTCRALVEKFVDLRDDLFDAASEIEAYQEESAEAVLGN